MLPFVSPASRQPYLENRLQNLDENDMPRVPEVWLDESFCHIHHRQSQTWVKPGGVVYSQGRKPLLVIFGGFCTYVQDGVLKAEMVEGCTEIWDPAVKLGSRAGNLY